MLAKKVAFNTLVQVISKAVGVFFTLLTTILLIGYLGRQGFGDYIYIITLMIIFGALADWGTTTIGVRETAKETERQGQILAHVLILKFSLAILASIIFVIFGFLMPLPIGQPAVLRQVIVLASLFLMINTLKASFGVVFQARLQMQKQAVVNIITSGLIFFISWLMIQAQLGLVALILAYLAATVVGMIIAAFLARGTVRFIFRFNSQIMARLIKESLPMGAILLMFTIDNKVDTVMLGAIKGSGAVGIYGVVYRVYDVLILGAAFLMNALLPVFSQWSRKQWGTKQRRVYQQTFDVLLIGGIAVAVVAWWTAPLVVRLLTGQHFLSFVEAVNVLRILVIAMIPAYFNHLTGYTIVALGKQRRYFFVALTAVVFNIGVNLLVIPRFSFYGAAAVTILTEAIVLIITTIFIFKLLGFMPSLLSFPKAVNALLGRLCRQQK